jgi:hypothetical protein
MWRVEYYNGGACWLHPSIPADAISLFLRVAFQIRERKCRYDLKASTSTASF